MFISNTAIWVRQRARGHRECGKSPNGILFFPPSEGHFLGSNTKFAMNPRKMLFFSVKSFLRSSACFTFIQVKGVNESFKGVHVKMPCAGSFKCKWTLITEDNERTFVWKGVRHFLFYSRGIWLWFSARVTSGKRTGLLKFDSHLPCPVILSWIHRSHFDDGALFSAVWRIAEWSVWIPTATMLTFAKMPKPDGITTSQLAELWGKEFDRLIRGEGWSTPRLSKAVRTCQLYLRSQTNLNSHPRQQSLVFRHSST